MTPTDTAPTQGAYPVIEAERDLYLAQRDSARREVARLRAALTEIESKTTPALTLSRINGLPDTDEIQDLRAIRAIALSGVRS